ncbi:aminotransferase class III-fold pyridoxal phosphate-dependent enzyme [Pseudomonadota bacterium]
MNKHTTTVSLENQWMPFTGNRDFKSTPHLMVRGEGLYYWNDKNEKILDGSSGLFCCAAGHCRPEITAAVAEQLSELDFAPPFQMGHPLAFELATKVAKHTPQGLNRILFVNSGSEAVDSAMKIAYAYHRARGEGQRQRFVSRERAYHGVNLGGTALGGLVRNREAFGVGLPGVTHLRHTWLEENRFVQGQPEYGAHLAEDLQRFVDLYGAETITACFVEPIAGSTGVLVPPKGYLERLREICDENEILLVFDEVICGFGRTGKAFAADSFAVRPDMITMAKALTNGAQPMGAVAVDEKIYHAIVESSPKNSIELFHGYTYSGHPAACAAGIAMMQILEKENLFARAAELSTYFLDQVFALKRYDAITDIRGYGMIAGFDVAPKGKTGQGLKFQRKLYAAGLHVKTTGDSGIIAPPLIAERSHIDELCGIMAEVLEDLE